MKILIAIVLAAFLTPAVAQVQGGIPGVVAPGAKVELVQEGFVFTEGPIGTANGELIFTDIRTSRIYRLDAKGTVAIVREGTNGANGLALAKNGDILAAESAGKRISRIGASGPAVTLTQGSSQRPLLEPNDLIADANGGIYFTDSVRPVVLERKVYVYYLAAGAREPLVIDDELHRPNGLALSRDGKTLYVCNSVSDFVWAYDINADGTVKNKRAFIRLNDIPPGKESGADGMAVDRGDRIYVTTMLGVQVFDKTGRYLGTIRVPRQPANIAFSGPGKRTLYITAREGLYRVRMLAQGPERLGK